MNIKNGYVENIKITIFFLVVVDCMKELKLKFPNIPNTQVIPFSFRRELCFTISKYVTCKKYCGVEVQLGMSNKPSDKASPL